MKNHNFKQRVVQALLGAFCCLSLGCETLHEAGVPGMEPFIDVAASEAEEQKYRQRYQESRDPDALRWLLRNRIHSGMTVSDVNYALGQEGVRQYKDRWIKTGGGHYHTGDVVYKWGPDREANSIYLAFRDGRLVNFDPQEYGDTAPDFNDMQLD